MSPKNINRRNFISGIAIGGLAHSFLDGSVSFASQEPSKYGRIVCPSSQSRRSLLGKNESSEVSDLVVYDIDRDEQYSILIPLGLAHSLALNPIDKQRGVVAEIFGDYACEVDFKERKVIQKMEAQKGRVFSGHTVYSQDGKHLFSPEYLPKAPEKGAVTIRELSTGKVVSELSTYGVRPHEVAWMSDEVLAISHYGHYPKVEPSDLKASVTLINIKTGQLIKNILPENKNYAMCHLQFTPSGKLYILTLNALERKGDIWDELRKIRVNPGELRKIGYKNGLTGHDETSFSMVFNQGQEAKLLKSDIKSQGFSGTLSVAYHEKTKTVAMTHVSDKLITFWDAETHLLKNKISFLGYPAGLALTMNNKFYVTMDDQGVVFLIDPLSLKVYKKASLGISAASGSAHIYILPPV